MSINTCPSCGGQMIKGELKFEAGGEVRWVSPGKTKGTTEVTTIPVRADPGSPHITLEGWRCEGCKYVLIPY